TRSAPPWRRWRPASPGTAPAPTPSRGSAPPCCASSRPSSRCGSRGTAPRSPSDARRVSKESRRGSFERHALAGGLQRARDDLGGAFEVGNLPVEPAGVGLVEHVRDERVGGLPATYGVELLLDRV